MAATTIYDVKLRYTLEDKTTRALGRMGKGADSAAKSFNQLKAAALGYFGGGAAFKALVGFNSTIEDTKTQIAGMLALSKKTDLVDQVKNADRLYAKLQKRAKSLPGTTAEYAEMLGMITQPASKAGLSLKELEDITVSSVVAAKAFGVEASAAARDIGEMLGQGKFGTDDVFASKIMGTMGFDGEKGREKFKALSNRARVDVVKAALAQKQITQLAAAQGQTFAGKMSTLQDSVQQFFGSAGQPLFDALKKELDRVNAWADNNTDKIAAWADKLGKGLVSAFEFVKDAIAFMVDHSDTLLTIAKAWAMMKVGGMIGGGIGGMIGAVGGGNAGSKAGSVAGALTAGFTIGTVLNDHFKLSSKLADGALLTFNKAGAALDRMDVGISRVSDQMDQNFAAERKERKRLNAIGDKAAADFEARTGISMVDDPARLARQFFASSDQAMQFGVASRNKADEAGRIDVALRNTKNGITDADTLRSLGLQQKDVSAARAANLAGGAAGFRDLQGKSVDLATEAWMNQFSKLNASQQQSIDIESAQAKWMEIVAQSLREQLKNGGTIAGLSVDESTLANILKAQLDGNKPSADKGNRTNITIQRIEVQSEDPDRFVFGMEEAIHQVAKNPGSARRAFREG